MYLAGAGGGRRVVGAPVVEHLLEPKREEAGVRADIPGEALKKILCSSALFWILQKPVSQYNTLFSFLSYSLYTITHPSIWPGITDH